MASFWRSPFLYNRLYVSAVRIIKIIVLKGSISSFQRDRPVRPFNTGDGLYMTALLVISNAVGMLIVSFLALTYS